MIRSLVTLDEAAAHLHVSVKTVRRRIADGTIPAVRIGRLIRIPAAALEELAPGSTIDVAARASFPGSYTMSRASVAGSILFLR
ncbi:Putative DNA-binding proteinA [Microbacterium lemovicicum]|uniref:DNA-binding proteinA n=1 Tax=Microbacterium lemovicicum TaxID=1072463 RepID=A0A3Q9IZR2_9MICO|nr:helix-turn-helix domain-containing protein [Microbacterium lemovicicum]AZS36807.1 Putative DNA-binding proteinA [Microbacterium lemovicicum]